MARCAKFGQVAATCGAMRQVGPPALGRGSYVWRGTAPHRRSGRRHHWQRRPAPLQERATPPPSPKRCRFSSMICTGSSCTSSVSMGRTPCLGSGCRRAFSRLRGHGMRSCTPQLPSSPLPPLPCRFLRHCILCSRILSGDAPRDASVDRRSVRRLLSGQRRRVFDHRHCRGDCCVPRLLAAHLRIADTPKFTGSLCALLLCSIS